MESSISNRRVALLMAAGLVLIAWGSFGFFDRLQQGRGGFTYMPDYVVNFVEPNGAAEKAGLLLGDRVVRVEGAAVEDLPLYSRWPRALSPGAGGVAEHGGET